MFRIIINKHYLLFWDLEGLNGLTAACFFSVTSPNPYLFTLHPLTLPTVLGNACWTIIHLLRSVPLRRRLSLLDRRH